MGLYLVVYDDQTKEAYPVDAGELTEYNLHKPLAAAHIAKEIDKTIERVLLNEEQIPPCYMPRKED